MFNFSGITARSVVGKVLRLPLRLIPKNKVMRIRQGKMKGMRWVAGSHTHGCWLGSYEFDKQVFMAERLRPGGVFLDIGAHVGFYTLLGSRLVGDEGKVISFEPCPRNIAYQPVSLARSCCYEDGWPRGAASHQPYKNKIFTLDLPNIRRTIHA
jgi:hypothetical protein